MADEQASTLVTLVVKADGEGIQSNALQAEDEFAGMYQSPNNADNQVIQPPYVPAQLRRIAQENHALPQCIGAMEINVHGTGAKIVEVAQSEDETPPAIQTEIDRVLAFLREPYPGETLVKMRRRLGVDIETIGYGGIEVIRNSMDEITFLRYIDLGHVRMMKLSEPITVSKEITGSTGKRSTVTMLVRERRFVQKIGQRLMYFKEYGVSRDVDKNTGDWGEPGNRLPYQKRASEILLFKALDDADTPYGVPRWIGQMPSVLGSREAEELNLEYFRSGGIPPIMVFLKGGKLTPDAEKALNNILTGKAREKLRGAVLSVVSTEGSISGSSSANVNVERFGSDRQSDSMFEGYLEKSEKRIRSSFRLPPMFVGRIEEYNLATAIASYGVAEAQVFAPERVEFDDTINTTLMRELTLMSEEIKFKSNPIVVHDTAVQLNGLQAADGKVEPMGWVAALNGLTGLDLKYDSERDADSVENRQASQEREDARREEDRMDRQEQQNAMAQQSQPPQLKAVPVAKAEEERYVFLDALAWDRALLLGLVEGEMGDRETLKKSVKERLESLSDQEVKVANALFTGHALGLAQAVQKETVDVAVAAETCQC